MRIVFMGTPEFAVAPLEGLLKWGNCGGGLYPAGQTPGPGHENDAAAGEKGGSGL